MTPLSSPLDSDQATLPLDRLLTALLNFVCAETAWEYGEAWIPQTDGSVLELSSAWCLGRSQSPERTIAWMQFQICSQAFVLHPNEGLPGRVWSSKQPEWLVDASVQSETYFLRNQIAQALSVKAGLGLPILSGNSESQVLAIVVFFMAEAKSADAVLIRQTETAIARFQQLAPTDWSCELPARIDSP